MNMYKVLSSRAKGLDETRRAGHARVTGANSVTREGVKMKIELVDATRYEMRVFLKSFPLPDSFQVGTDFQVPQTVITEHSCLNLCIGRALKLEGMSFKYFFILLSNITDAPTIITIITLEQTDAPTIITIITLEQNALLPVYKIVYCTVYSIVYTVCLLVDELRLTIQCTTWLC